MTAIISTAIAFSTDDTVKAYMQIPAADRPEADVQVECNSYKISYRSIILLNADGTVAARWLRRLVRGFAVDGHAIPVHGPEFKRIGCGDEDSDAEEAGADAPEDEDASPETEDTEE